VAANTVLIRVDTVEKDTWDAILALAGESASVTALTEAEEALLALAGNADALLALLESESTPEAGT